MSVETILAEMNAQNVAQMAGQGIRTESILRCEREINNLGFNVGFKYGTFYIIEKVE